MAELADAHGRRGAGRAARAPPSARARPMEKTYWLADRGFYAFATKLARPDEPSTAEPGPRRERRQARLDELSEAHARSTRTRCCRLFRCGGARSTPARAISRSIISGSGRMATDWGHRLISDQQRALRSALLSLRLGVAALHRVGLDGRVPLRPAARRLSGVDGERAAHLRRRARLRHRAALGRLQCRRSAARRITRSGPRRWW